MPSSVLAEDASKNRRYAGAQEASQRGEGDVLSTLGRSDTVSYNTVCERNGATASSALHHTEDE